MAAKLGTVATPWNPAAITNQTASKADVFGDGKFALQIAETGTLSTPTGGIRKSTAGKCATFTMPSAVISSDRYCRIVHTLSPAWSSETDGTILEVSFGLKVSTGGSFGSPATTAHDEAGVDVNGFTPEIMRVNVGNRRIQMQMRRAHSATADLLADTFDLLLSTDYGVTRQPNRSTPNPEIVEGQWHHITLYVSGIATECTPAGAAWGAGTDYAVTNVKQYDGKDYACIATVAAADAWVSEAEYAKDANVTYSSMRYKALKAHSLQTTTPDLDTTNWTPWAPDSDTVRWQPAADLNCVLLIDGMPVRFENSGSESAVNVTAFPRDIDPTITVTSSSGYTVGDSVAITGTPANSFTTGSNLISIAGRPLDVLDAPDGTSIQLSVNTAGFDADWSGTGSCKHANPFALFAGNGFSTVAPTTVTFGLRANAPKSTAVLHAEASICDVRILTKTDASSSGRQALVGLWPVPQSATAVTIAAHMTEVCTSATCDYGTTSSYGLSATGDVETDGGRVVKFALTGLAANTTYHYQLTLKCTTEPDGYITKDFTFKTDAGASSDVTILVTNDNQDYAGRAQTARNMLLETADLVVTAGDVCDMMSMLSGDDAGMWEYESPSGHYASRAHMVHRASQCLRDLATSHLVLPGLGNHEMDPYHSDNNPSWTEWLSRVPQPAPNYSYSWGRAHFAHIGPMTVTSAVGPEYGKLDLDWLAADLDRSDRAWNVVICHYPGYGDQYYRLADTKAAESSTRPLKNRWELHQILRDYGAQVCIGAHINHFNCFVDDGVTYLINGAPGTAGGGTAYANDTDQYEDWGEDLGNYGTAPTEEEGAFLTPHYGSMLKSKAAYGGYLKIAFYSDHAHWEFVNRLRGLMDGPSSSLRDQRRIIAAGSIVLQTGAVTRTAVTRSAR